MLPDAGDVAWVEFDPVRGTEQAGRRPALVLSDRSYHEISSRALVCPISTRGRAWPFNVPIPAGQRIEGVILVDQIRMIHRPSRFFEILDTLPPSVIAEVRGVLAALSGLRLDSA